jgi:carboxylesterase type B
MFLQTDLHIELSPGLSVTMQVLAYGGQKPIPFHQAICESTALEPSATSNITRVTWETVTKLSGCNASDPHSEATLICMRNIPLATLLNTTIAQQATSTAQTGGDIYLPTVDGDFLPAAASELVETGRFAKMPMILGWTEQDGTLFTDREISTPAESDAFVRLNFPNMVPSTMTKFLELYPITDFSPNATANLSAEFYRTAQIIRDGILTCPNFLVAHAMAKSNPDVYLYSHNATIFSAALDFTLPGDGVIHTSEIAYVFGNLSLYEFGTYGLVDPSPQDWKLARQMSRSWSTFAYTGKPSLDGHNTLEGWEQAYSPDDDEFDAQIYVVGGPTPGMTAIQGSKVENEAIAREKLAVRCGFLNSDQVILQLMY